MRIFNVAKIGVLLLCILLVLPMMTGCANELREQKDDAEIKQEQLEQIEQEWGAVMKNENDYVTKIEIRSYTHQPPTVVDIQPSQEKTCTDVDQIAEIIDLFESQEHSFENLPENEESFEAYSTSKYGKKVYAIVFFDSQDQKIMRITIYEDNNVEVYEPYPGGWQSVCIVRISKPIFETVKGFFDNLE